MDPVIVTCGCGDTDSFAQDAFKLLFPKHPLPLIKNAEELVESAVPSSIAREQLKALHKAKTKFAYYMKFDEEDNFECWDLLKGVRIA